MKLTAAIFISVATLAIAHPALADSDKVTICHAAGREGTTHFETLEISTNAVFKDQGGHFYENGTPQAGHEQDYLGPCTPITPSTTTPPDTTPSTSSPTTPPTDPESTSTIPAPTQPVDDPTTTSSAPTIIETLNTEPATTATVSVGTAPVPTTSDTVPPKLPKTGSGTGLLALIALGLLSLGGGATALARRR